MLFAGWVNRRQLDVIDYIKEEDRVLREQLGSGRLRFTDDQRRRFAVKGRALGRRALDGLAGLTARGTAQSAKPRAPASRFSPPAGDSPAVRTDSATAPPGGDE